MDREVFPEEGQGLGGALRSERSTRWETSSGPLETLTVVETSGTFVRFSLGPQRTSFSIRMHPEYVS